ncbi:MULTISPECIES: PEPxxWA-CTERM sorting domain-containing protein [unclassified Phenylobacterium]|uniref:PEPxxWA-CTERM sorting domain-containing protein n=1 Tax=unclassified Phenylobacterium TaxID=2640670 RepID=UPI0012E3D96B|nr:MULTISPECIES: PEPxxWA-CTERM sorting domain-containing protein [unclassified Phenylobacterium]
MFRTFLLSVALAASVAAISSPAAAAIKQIDFTVSSGDWQHLNGVNGPYGLSLQPTLSGSLRFDDTKADSSAFVSLDYVTGTRVWTLADIAANSSIFYSGGAFSAFALHFGSGNLLASNTTASVAEGPNTLYCNNCVSIGPVSAVPEPQTWALMIAGFGLLGTALRRRKAMLAS